MPALRSAQEDSRTASGKGEGVCAGPFPTGRVAGVVGDAMGPEHWNNRGHQGPASDETDEALREQGEV